MRVQMVGCSHHRSPVAVRERLAFTPTETERALATFHLRFPETEAVLLSTCNRVEVYTAVEEPAALPTHQQVAEFLAEFHGLELYEIFDDLFERTGEDAVRHLFTVAASLDSMVVGEPQILAQVKQAYQLANEHASTGPLTHAIFQAALKVARRVQSETLLGQRRVSIPSVAVADFAAQIFERFDDKRVLVVGAGEMAEETVRYLRDAGARDIAVVNRTHARAVELAESFGGRAGRWEDLHQLLVEVDLVVSATGAAECVVGLDEFAKIEAQRFQRPLAVLDLAIPRDFDPAIGRLLGVYLYSIDDLREVCQRNQRERDRELPSAIAIIEEETAAFMAELQHRATGPIIQRLKQGWEEPKEAELRRLFNKLPELDPRSRDEIRHAFDRLMNKLLHPPLESLRDEARQGSVHGLLDALKRLFQLKD